MARWAAVVGLKSQGLSEEIRDLAAACEAAGLSVGGFAQYAADAENQRYELHHLRSGESIALSAPSDSPGAIAVCDFAFSPTAFDHARRWATEDAADCDVLFVDQVGKLEVRGLGHYRTLAALLSPEHACVVVLCVRTHQLVNVINRFSPQGDPLAHLAFPASTFEREQFVASLCEALHRDR